MFLILLLSLFYKVPTIQITYMDGSFYIKEDSIEIGWIHSVEKEPWFETFERKGNSLYLESTRFKTYGAGTPYRAQVVPSTDGFVHMKLNEKIEELRLTVSDNVKTTVYVGERVIPLYEILEDYETVVIEVTKIPLWRLLRGEGKWQN